MTPYEGHKKERKGNLFAYGSTSIKRLGEGGKRKLGEAKKCT